MGKVRRRRGRTVLLAVAITLLAGGLLTGAGGVYLVHYALMPDHRGKRVDDSYRYMYAAYPELKPWTDSLRQTGALRDTFILAPDHTRLHALYVAAPQSTRKTAVIVHGYTDNAVRMLMIGRLYSSGLGYNILLPDLRDAGLSGGDHIQMGWNDRKDVMQWMAVADSLFGGHTQMVLHGISMGAATVMCVSGETLPPYVKALVEDCGFTSVWAQFAKELREQFHLPPFPLLYAANEVCRFRFGWNFGEASPRNQVARCLLPMLFIHGGADTYVPTSMGREVYAAKPQPKRLWIVPGAGHALSYKLHPEAYARVVADFLRRYNP